MIFWRRKTREAELDEELRAHLAWPHKLAWSAAQSSKRRNAQRGGSLETWAW